jgi:hypothetical protein
VTATISEVTVQAPDAQAEFYRPKPRQERGKFTARERVRFTPDQQAVFDREWRKREAKIRRQYDGLRRDLLDTVAVTQQVLELCKDRISLDDEVAIRDGLREIQKEYETWQTGQQ